MDFDISLYKDIDIKKDDIIFKIKDSKVSKIDSNTFISNLEDGESEYINLIENLGFNSIGENSIPIDKEDLYIIDFLGIAKDIKVELFVISYTDKSKLKVENVLLNDKLYFYPYKEAKSIRLAIKVTGKGEFSISDIKMYKALIDKFKNHDDINSLVVNKPSCLKDLRVACIFDEFTMNCFKDMVEVIPITPYNWKLELTIKRPHILIVESAWEGKDKLWYRKISSSDMYGLSILKEVTCWCKENNIPTMFWNKEDPVHFKSFINASKLFDYVFTTDEGSIDNYVKKLNHDRVYAMPFACQPNIHNPIKYHKERINKACFAGTYYGERFKDRKIDTDNILNASIEAIGLDIYDRQLGVKNSVYRFPSEYQDYIKGNLKPYELDITNKGYKVSLNVNSVKDSNTMFSRRVFESVASGTPTVSSYSKGINEIFGEIVFCSDDFNDLKYELEKLNNDEIYYYKKVIKGIRLCMSNHTYQNRLEYMLEKAGIDLGLKSKFVSLVSVIESDYDIYCIKDIYDKQIYDNKELVLIFKDEELFNSEKLEAIDNVKKIILNENIDVSKIISGDYVAIINTNSFYSKYYIKDLVNASKYCQAEFIGKRTYLTLKRFIVKSLSIENSGCEFEYVNSLDLDKCIFISEVLDRCSLSEFISYIDNNIIDRFKYGYRYFSIDRYNFIDNCNELGNFDIDMIEI
jgi:spore maturation protein CgeB